MNTIPDNSVKRFRAGAAERGAALATAILMLGLLSAISLTVLAVVTTETKVAGSDLCRTQTFYAASSGIEKMTTDFGLLFAKSSVTTQSQYDTIAASPPDLTSDGFAFTQSLTQDQTTLDAMRTTQSISAPTYPTVSVTSGPLTGLTAAVIPYIMNTTATSACAQVTLERRMNNYLVPIFQFGMFSNEDMEIHPGALFTFNGRVHANGNLYVNGVVTFQDKVTTAGEVVRDVLRNSSAAEPSAGAATHSGTVTFTKGTTFSTTLDESTTAANCLTTAARCASVLLGPNVGGNDPLSPTGTINTDWKTNSVSKFGGQLLTKSTGVVPLLLPLQLDNNPTRELIKRRLTTTDSQTLSDSRYHSKSEIRILLDDESPSSTDAAGIPAGQGVVLSTFNPIPMPNLATSATITASGGGRALWRVSDTNTGISNSYNETATSYVLQSQNGANPQADTVRGVKATPATKTISAVTKTTGVAVTITSTAHGYATGDLVQVSNVTKTSGSVNATGQWVITVVNANTFTLNGTTGGGAATYTVAGATALKLEKSVANGTVIPYGAGITGRILIEIVKTVGGTTTTYDVTKEVLSMGMTEGEPNSVVALQRPLWAAYTQGSRDSSGSTNPILNGDPVYTNCLTDILNKTHIGADGEIKNVGIYPTQDSTWGFLTNIVDDAASGASPTRADIPTTTAGDWNSIVPINVYNVREGRINAKILAANAIYERGMTSIVELNMKNVARWVDGVFDNNLLGGTNAVSANIGSPDGFIVYVSDRRGDKVKTEVIDTAGTTLNMTNGMDDNEDIYNYASGVNGGVPDPGEDVIDFLGKKNTLQKDVTELPDPAVLTGASTSSATIAERTLRANVVAAWKNPSNYFRRAVRLFDAEDLNPNRSGGPLADTKGITISSENMVYIWGNYNTTGINTSPAAGVSCLNDAGASGGCYYQGDQVPASIICDAFFPLSKTWFDSVSGMFPDDFNNRPADRNLASVQAETAMRAGIIAGNNLSALSPTSAAGDYVGNFSTTADNNEARLNGGMHNFPRFLEGWSTRFNFVGSLIPLWHSTQAMGQYQNQAGSTIYNAPLRDWAFDITFATPEKLPPGTPQFQYTEPTAFRQIMY